MLDTMLDTMPKETFLTFLSGKVSIWTAWLQSLERQGDDVH